MSTYVPVDLGSSVAAANAYLLATLAWSSAGEKLAVALEVCAHLISSDVGVRWLTFLPVLMYLHGMYRLCG